MLQKDENIEQKIPVEWRPAIVGIVENIRRRSLKSEKILDFYCYINPQDARLIYNSIEAYGENLVSLPSATWQTSICRWMGNYWHLLVDLFTANEGLSDLVLFIDVKEREGSLDFVVQSVHVP